VSRSAAFPKSEREKYGSLTEKDIQNAKSKETGKGMEISNYMSEHFAEDEESKKALIKKGTCIEEGDE
jgi:hypothetical protein